MQRGIRCFSVQCVLTTAVFLASAPAKGGTIYVPNQHRTIQGAIEAARTGDVIVVLANTYHERLDFLGKNITLQSTAPNDPLTVAATVIDGGSTGPAVTFARNEARHARLLGFTIRSGDVADDTGAPDSAGVTGSRTASTAHAGRKRPPHLTSAGRKPDVGVCTSQEGCSSARGVYCRNSSPIIERCYLIAHGGEPGAPVVRCIDGKPIFRDCEFVVSTHNESQCLIRCEHSAAEFKARALVAVEEHSSQVYPFTLGAVRGTAVAISYEPHMGHGAIHFISEKVNPGAKTVQLGLRHLVLAPGALAQGVSGRGAPARQETGPGTAGVYVYDKIIKDPIYWGNDMQKAVDLMSYYINFNGGINWPYTIDYYDGTPLGPGHLGFSPPPLWLLQQGQQPKPNLPASTVPAVPSGVPPK